MKVMELRDTIILIVGFVVVAGVLALLLRMVLSGQSNTAIERLKRINQDNLQRELELKKKLDEAEIQYQKRMAEASGDIQKIKEKMEEDMSGLKNRIVTAAEKEKEGILADARQEVNDLKNELGRSTSRRVAEFSQEVIGKLFSTSDGSDKMVVGLHQYLLDEAINKIKSLNPENIRGALASGRGEVEVSSRLALTPHQKQSLNELFSGIAPKSVKITEKPPDSKHLAGVSIKVGGMIIDATLNNRLKEILSGMAINPDVISGPMSK